MKKVHMSRTVRITQLEMAMDEVEKIEWYLVARQRECATLKKYIKGEMRKAQKEKQ